jgi:peptidoglycan/xylan/chitin deacetylase (PgdA/CDA1 family)
MKSMQARLTIVMYHYVRDLEHTRFPRIKGLNVAHFREQIAYMQRFYEFVSVNQCIEAIYCGYEIPQNAALLTFDDGYRDHYLNVFPILCALGIQGVFFPPVCAVRDWRVIDMNKIHFILASVNDDPGQLTKDIFSALDRLRSDGHAVAPNKELYDKLAIQSEWDSPQTIFVKRLLQRELSQDLRALIVDELFKSYVAENELAFARDLYMNEEQLREMSSHGMVIGNHGYEHRWMNTISPLEQRWEIENSLDFLQLIGMSTENWLMCYPYGAHDESLRSICSDFGCGMAFTTEVGIANLNMANALILPRVDTNHLPKDKNALPNMWTQTINL